jgi:hypothetical protein
MFAVLVGTLPLVKCGQEGTRASKGSYAQIHEISVWCSNVQGVLLDHILHFAWK